LCAEHPQEEETQEAGLSRQDPLDTETSVSVALSDRGVEAKAKSRIIAAVDRLGGNLLDLINAPLERRLRRSRAISDGEMQLIEAAARYGVERTQTDPDFARRALEHHFKQAIDAQSNRDAVLVEALDDLGREPPTGEDAASGEPILDDQFMARFERYAEDATTEELQQRWGRVLAREVRKPGTFSAKALRIVDELDAPTALLFERLCESRLADVLPWCLVGELAFNEQALLTEAGLLIEPGLTGQRRLWAETKMGDSQAVWAFKANRYVLAFPKDAIPQEPGVTAPVRLEDQRMGTPVYVLTEVGSAISTMLPNREKDAIIRMASELKKVISSEAVMLFELNPFTNKFVQF